MTVSQQYVRAVAVLAGLAFLVALFLVHFSSFHDFNGEKPTDPDDPDSPTESVTVEVECASPAKGPEETAAASDEDALSEDYDYALDEVGLEPRYVSATCGRIRTERVTHAGELAVLGLLLTGAAVVERHQRRHDRENGPRTRTPRPSRREREDGVL